MTIEKEKMYLKIMSLIDEYGEASYNFGDYQFEHNREEAYAKRKELEEMIDEIFFNY